MWFLKNWAKILRTSCEMVELETRYHKETYPVVRTRPVDRYMNKKIAFIGNIETPYSSYSRSGIPNKSLVPTIASTKLVRQYTRSVKAPPKYSLMHRVTALRRGGFNKEANNEREKAGFERRENILARKTARNVTAQAFQAALRRSPSPSPLHSKNNQTKSTSKKRKLPPLKYWNFHPIGSWLKPRNHKKAKKG